MKTIHLVFPTLFLLLSSAFSINEESNNRKSDFKEYSYSNYLESYEEYLSFSGFDVLFYHIDLNIEISR